MSEVAVVGGGQGELSVPLDRRPRVMDPAPAPSDPSSENRFTAADFLKPNAAKAEVLPEDEPANDRENAAPDVEERYGGADSVTLGSTGMPCASDVTSVYLPAIAVRSVETVAAKDFFYGAIAAETSNISRSTVSLAFAMKDAARSTPRTGDPAAFLTFEEVRVCVPR
ncbi:PfkB family carbohydrate kinase [Tropicimonas isoalkanivorans]|uniref:PfkB family carbohydrate kinase n=1 Tax=Tropicimonas isoalkanivorans TaxID=441112 RepID=UPI0011607830|nr:PfkB family carbohydrate kinase [Tropicimonas isoalkanivorans]